MHIVTVAVLSQTFINSVSKLLTYLQHFDLLCNRNKFQDIDCILPVVLVFDNKDPYYKKGLMHVPHPANYVPDQQHQVLHVLSEEE